MRVMICYLLRKGQVSGINCPRLHHGILGVACFILLFGTGPVDGQTPEQECRAAIIGYAANIEAFPFYRCRFKKTYAEAKTIVDVLAGKWQKARSVELNYVVDGEYEAFEQFGNAVPPAPKPSKSGKAGLTYTKVEGFNSIKFLRAGMGHGHYTRGVDAINLQRIEIAPDTKSDINTPLDLGFGHRDSRGPDRMLAQPGQYFPTFLGKQVIDGLPLIGVRFDEPRYKLVYEFWLDPARGYLPVRFDQQTTGGQHYRSVLLSAHEFTSGRWFPERLLGYGPLDATGSPVGPLTLEEIQVLELDVEHRPKPDDLTLEFPAGTQVFDVEKPRGFFYLKQDERISAYDLPELFDKAARAGTQPLMDTGLEHKWRRPVWPWVTGAAGAVLLLLGGYLWYRRRQRRLAAT